MRLTCRLALIGALFFVFSVAEAGICDKGGNFNFSDDTVNEENYYRKIFLESDYFGNKKYNKVILECNRKRDTNGNQVQKALGGNNTSDMKSLLEADDLDWKVIRGYYNFKGTVVTRQNYRYLVRKQNGMWEVILPYKASIADKVKNRVDFFMGYRGVLNADNGTLAANDESGPAWDLYDASQVTKNTFNSQTSYQLKASAQPIAETHCQQAHYFTKNDKYTNQHGFDSSKRDLKNKHIDLGLIQYRYKKYDDKDENDYSSVREGCRVSQSMDLYWLDKNELNADGSDNTTRVVKTTPRNWIFDNFIRVGEKYWSTPSNFKLRIWLKGYNDAAIGQNLISKFTNSDPLRVYFATKFMPHGGNQMYKSNLAQFNNFSTMTTDGTYRHEVGHAFGLDDEYGGGSKNDCMNKHYNGLGSPSRKDYMMCDGYSGDEVTTIYHYIAVSRYGTVQKECSNDSDCKNNEWCDGGIDLKKNQCRALLNDGAACPAVGGGHACKSGNCKFAKCYTPGSVKMGGSCFVNDQCSQGKCNNVVDGTNGTCVCKNNSDCGDGFYCDGGLDLKKNACRALKNDGAACPAVGGGHACKSGHCKFAKCYTPDSVKMGGSCFVSDQCSQGKCNNVVDGANGTCVCKKDTDCGDGFYCDGGLDLKQNACRALKADNTACAAAGGGPSCASGSCKFGRCYTANSINIGSTCYVNSSCKSGQCSNGIDGTKGQCVCKSDADCGSDSVCKVGTLGIGLNHCVATQTPSCKSGWSYENRNPLNKDRCNKTTTKTAALKCKLLVTDKAKNWTGPHAKSGADECRSKKGKDPKGVKCPSGYKYSMKSGADSCTKSETDHETPTCPSGWNYKSQSGKDICEDT